MCMRSGRLYASRLDIGMLLCCYYKDIGAMGFLRMYKYNTPRPAY